MINFYHGHRCHATAVIARLLDVIFMLLNTQTLTTTLQTNILMYLMRKHERQMCALLFTVPLLCISAHCRTVMADGCTSIH